MSTATLDALIAHERSLVAALDDGDASAIEAAAERMRIALLDVAAMGAWTVTPQTKAQLQAALRVAEAARARVNYLADDTRRRLDRLTVTSGGVARTHAYRRSGRLL